MSNSPKSSTGVLRRAAGKARRVKARLTTDGSTPEELQAARDRNRKLKEKVEELKAANAELKEEVLATRRSVRDPHPDLPLDEKVMQVIHGVREEHLSYLGVADLQVLARATAFADHSGHEGLIIEAGTARGGSAIAMAAAKDPARPMKVYDVFGMIPEPSEEDGEDIHKRYEKIKAGESKGVGGETYYGYRDDLYTEVTESFARHGVEVGANNVDLVQGLFQDTIDLSDQPVAFAHLDGDWYESTIVCLERIAPLLVTGGRIVLDDYYHWSGCRKAVDEYFAGRDGYRLERRTKIHVVRL